MKNKKMNKEILAELSKEVLLGQLLNCQVFAWENEEETPTLKEKIVSFSAEESWAIINRIGSSLAVKGIDIIKRLKSKAKTWSYEKLLDHLKLRRHWLALSNSFN